MAVYWTESDSSAANTAKTVTHAAAAGRKHYVTDLAVSIRGATSGNDVRVEIRDEDDNVLWDQYIDAVRGLAIDQHFTAPKAAPPGKAVKAVVAAAGASAIATISIGGYTQ